MIDKILPQNSTQRKVAKKLLSKAGLIRKNNYSLWRHEQKDKIKLYPIFEHEKKPLISIVVPMFNTPEKYLIPLLRSIADQTYPNWQAVLVDVSSDESLSKKIHKASNIDTRITVYISENKSIAENTNFGIKKSKGEYIAFMDHDDVLELNALDEIVAEINRNPNAGVIYTDEDKLTEDGSDYIQPFFKPDWSPHLFMHVNYINHLTAIKKSYIEKANYLDAEKDGAQDFDLLNKVIDLGAKVYHVPKVLYHWRIADNSTAADISNKKYVLNAGEQSLNEHFRRIGLDAKVNAIENKPGFYDVSIEPNTKPTIIITPFIEKPLLLDFIKTINASGMLEACDVIIPNCGLENPNIIEISNEKNYIISALEKSNDKVVFINEIVFPRDSKWAIDIAGMLEDSSVHAVSPVCVTENNIITDMGLVKKGYEEVNLFKGFNLVATNSPIGDTSWPRDVDKLSGACIAVRKEELQKFIKSNNNKKQDIKKVLQTYSAANNNRFNTVWTLVEVEKIREIKPKKEVKMYASPHLGVADGDLVMFADIQQTKDHLLYLQGKNNE